MFLFFKKIKLKLFLSICVGLVIVFICLNYYFDGLLNFECNYINSNTFEGVDLVLIGTKMNYENDKCILINDKKEIKELCSSIKWESEHLGDVEGCDYCISFVKGDNIVYTMRVFKDGYGYNRRAIKSVMSYIKQYNKMDVNKLASKYIVSSPISNNYGDLKTKLINMDYKVYSHYDYYQSPKKPFITLTYSDLEQRFPSIKNEIEFMSEYNLGEFTPDNIFFSAVDYIKENGWFDSISTVRFKEGTYYSKDKETFIRKINIYLVKPIDNAVIDKINKIWKQDIQYTCPTDYEFTIIMDHVITKQEADLLNKNYNIDIKDN